MNSFSAVAFLALIGAAILSSCNQPSQPTNSGLNPVMDMSAQLKAN